MGDGCGSGTGLDPYSIFYCASLSLYYFMFTALLSSCCSPVSWPSTPCLRAPVTNPATGAIFRIPDLYIWEHIENLLGKQYTNKFLNIGPNICQDFENNITETGGDSGDNFLMPVPGPFLVPDPRLFLFCTSHFYILKKDYITGGRGGVLRLKR